jgi:DNA mismatch repair protein MutS2
MDDKDLFLLEFPRIREIIADYCSFPLSREIALAVTPSSDFAEVGKRLLESTEARRLLEAEPSIGVSGIEDVAEAARAARRGKMLDPQTLNTVRVTIEVLRMLRDKIVCHAEEFPHLWAYAGNITTHKALESAISRAILPEGELHPNASDKLSSIRHRQRSHRSELIDKLQTYIASDVGKRYIQEPIVTEREGRFVIAVKSEHRGEVQGIVHDISNSGASIFVEPWQTLELGNAIKELQIEEQREIERILSECSALGGEASVGIAGPINAAAAIVFSLA